VLKDKPVHRVEFYEITRPPSSAPSRSARPVDHLINAQQARRALDYLVGFNLSPLLWKKVRRGLYRRARAEPGAALIVEREEEIERFKAREYWTIESDLSTKGQNFSAKLTQFQGREASTSSRSRREPRTPSRGRTAQQATGPLPGHRVEKKQRKRNPSPPFTTSTLQQEASRNSVSPRSAPCAPPSSCTKAWTSAARPVGLISYMRTDR